MQNLSSMKVKIILSVIGILLIASFIYNFSPETVRLPLLKTNRLLSGLSTKMITVGDHNIHYLEGGSGPTIILLHGIFSEKDHWVDFARHGCCVGLLSVLRLWVNLVGLSLVGYCQGILVVNHRF